MLKDSATAFGYILAAVIVVLQPYVVAWLNKQRKRKRFNKAMDIQPLIDAECAQLRVLLKAARVGTWQFSNGDESILGFCFRYASLIGENVAPGIEAIRLQMQKVPIYDFVPVIQAVSSSLDVYTYTPQTYPNTEIERYLLSTNCVRCTEAKLSTRIEDGVLSVMWNKNHTLTEFQMNEIKATATRIYHLVRSVR